MQSSASVAAGIKPTCVSSKEDAAKDVNAWEENRKLVLNTVDKVLRKHKYTDSDSLQVDLETDLPDSRTRCALVSEMYFAYTPIRHSYTPIRLAYTPIHL